jgi:ADP-ribose pyrophosphatase YjhB (NUDIX family)
VDNDLRLRAAVRAIVLDPLDRIFLVRFDFPHGAVWAAPGGGLEANEDDIAALSRELAEELGLREPNIGPCIWTRTHVFPMPTGHDGQTERFYLVRTDSFDPRPTLPPAELLREGITFMRWWTIDELRTSSVAFAPRALPELVVELLAAGPPDHPIDVGV